MDRKCLAICCGMEVMVVFRAMESVVRENRMCWFVGKDILEKNKLFEQAARPNKGLVVRMAEVTECHSQDKSRTNNRAK